MKKELDALPEGQRRASLIINLLETVTGAGDQNIAKIKEQLRKVVDLSIASSEKSDCINKVENEFKKKNLLTSKNKAYFKDLKEQIS